MGLCFFLKIFWDFCVHFGTILSNLNRLIGGMCSPYVYASVCSE